MQLNYTKQIYLAVDAKFEIFDLPVSFDNFTQRCNGKVESVSQCNRIYEQTKYMYQCHGLVLIIPLMSSGGSGDDNYFDRGQGEIGLLLTRSGEQLWDVLTPESALSSTWSMSGTNILAIVLVSKFHPGLHLDC
ncbi:hypothetical protein T03_5458 [Trichinella britovi]|uniref:Uncharacterized protein n=1 Tax=Trichinella britovi TaxID=45882 RepID=A0A0V1DH40_TRIBR|nr:hypothetical protein T03_5458 [Trichinella britovi]